MTALPVQAAQQPAAEAEGLEAAVRFARSEGQLEAALERVQAGFEAGHLSQEATERLIYLAVNTARQLAQGLCNVPVGVQ